MYRLDAKKVLSQNYLMDMNISRKIVRKAGNLTDKTILEIGPGPGGITRAILEKPCRRLDVVEIDERFLPPLEIMREKESAGRLHIHHDDIKKIDIKKLWDEANLETEPWHYNILPPAHIIANLPFNISTFLIARFMKQISERSGPWTFGRVPLTLTFQLEVAKRIISGLDSDARSRLSIIVQYVAEPKLMFEIPGRNFVPIPKVDVGVVQFIPRQEPLINAAFPVVEKLVRQAFLLKNKYLWKGLKTLYPKEMARDLSHELLKNCGMDPTNISVRIGIEEFADMCYYYVKQCKRHPGLFLYDYTRPSLTLDMLKDRPNAMPPEYTFCDSNLWKDGIPLSTLS